MYAVHMDYRDIRNTRNRSVKPIASEMQYRTTQKRASYDSQDYRGRIRLFLHTGINWTLNLDRLIDWLIGGQPQLVWVLCYDRRSVGQSVLA
jgi:hypothetical protein